MSDLASRASELLRLHHTGGTLVLPTVWDAWSARTVVEAGFRPSVSAVIRWPTRVVSGTTRA
jgi:2-methylisocitrate lyase-like PEP mutase family enzyme